MSLTEIVRTAILDHTVRNYQFLQIQHHTGCSRSCSKELMFAFLYYATEQKLQSILHKAQEGVTQ